MIPRLPLLAAGFSDIPPRDLLALAAILVAIVLMMMNVRRRINRERDSGAAQAAAALRPHDPALRNGHAVRRDIEQLMIELEELSRRISGEVETRYRKLEQVIADAERCIRELNRLIAESQRNHDEPFRVEKKSCPDSPSREPPQGNGELDEPPAGGVAVRPPPPSNLNEDPRYTSVYRLADQGVSAMDIARQLGRPVGEVELILDLRRS